MSECTPAAREARCATRARSAFWSVAKRECESRISHKHRRPTLYVLNVTKIKAIRPSVSHSLALWLAKKDSGTRFKSRDFPKTALQVTSTQSNNTQDGLGDVFHVRRV